MLFSIIFRTHFQHISLNALLRQRCFILPEKEKVGAICQNQGPFQPLAEGSMIHLEGNEK